MTGSLRDPRGTCFTSLSSNESFSSLRSYDQIPERVRRPSLLERLGDFTASDHGPASAARRLIYSPSFSQLPTETPVSKPAKIILELINNIDKNLKGVHQKGFWDALCVNDLIWILAWNRKVLGTKQTVLLNMLSPTYTVQVKQKHIDENAYIPTIMLLHKDQIFYARQGGKEILSFSVHSHSFNLSYSNNNLSVGAMCGDKKHLYILDQKHMDTIKVLDYTFCHKTDISTGIQETQYCHLDMCLIPNIHTNHQESMTTDNNVIVISKSAPYGFLRAVDFSGQLVWQIDSCTNPELEPWFNPYSVSSTASGDIFMADRDVDKIYCVSVDGNSIQEILGRGHGIHKPSRVFVDRKGIRLLVVNKDGHEIRNYQIKVESFTRTVTAAVPISGRRPSLDYPSSSLTSSHRCGSSVVTQDSADWEGTSGRESSSGFYSSLSLSLTKNSENDDINLKDLSKLARSIAPQKMSQIAVEHLEFDLDQLDHLEAACRLDMWKFNVRILTEWKNRRPENNRLKLASLLYEAAEDGLVNYAVVRDILGGGN